MVMLLGAGIALVATAVVVAWFVHLERTDRAQVPVAICIGLLVFESVLLPSVAEVPNGLFRVGAGGQDLRITGAAVLLALFARVVARGLPRSISATGVWWTVFGVWYAGAAATGWLTGASHDLVLFEARQVVYAAGAFLLLAGAPVSRLLTRRAVGAWAAVLVVGAGAIALLRLFEITYSLDTGVQRFPAIGAYDPSGRSVVVAVAAVLLVTEACRRAPRVWVVVGAGLLMLSPIVGSQRAALVQAGVTFVVIVLVAFGRTWHRRARFTPTNVTLVAIALGGMATLVVIGPPALTGERSIVVGTIDEAFSGIGQQESAEARVGLYEASRELIGERPLLGWGLGKQVHLENPYPLEPLDTTPHNIFLDTWLRAGVIGVLLFVGALVASLRDAAHAWRRHRDGVVAAFAIACSSAVIGLVAKGLFESIFDNFRLALLFGMLLGGIAAARAGVEDRPTTSGIGARATDAPRTVDA